MPEAIQLRCRDLAFHADLLLDLGIPDGSFGHHDETDLDEPCYCTEQATVDRGEDRRRCDSPIRIERAPWTETTDEENPFALRYRVPGFVFVGCCRCCDAATVDHDVLAEACRLIAKAITGGAAQPDPAICRSIREYRRRGASATEAALAVSLDMVAGGRR